MRTASQLQELSEEKRRKIQEGNVRKMLIGAYAPREPALMEALASFLRAETKYPLKLIHKILDRFAGMTLNTTVTTYGEIVEFVKSIPDDFAIAKGPCACRLHTMEELGPDARDMKSGNLEFCRETPLNVDIQIGACGEAFGALESYELISKEDLLELEAQCHDMGLVSNIYMMFGGDSGICHCSSATCIPFIANRALGGKTAFIQRGKLRASTDEEKCGGSGLCVQVCHFGARRLVEKNGRSVLEVDHALCFGCGLCAEVCPQQAVTMVPRRSAH